MPKNKKRILLATIGLFLGIFGVWRVQSLAQQHSVAPVRQFQMIQLGEHTLEVVLSTTPAQLQQGLSDRTTIGADGMLFVLPVMSRPVFWMYRMQFDLDFVWIAHGQVVDLHRNVPKQVPKVIDQNIAQVQPRVESEYVLEVPAGFIDQFGITMGTPFGLLAAPVDKMWEE